MKKLFSYLAENSIFLIPCFAVFLVPLLSEYQGYFANGFARTFTFYGMACFGLVALSFYGWQRHKFYLPPQGIQILVAVLLLSQLVASFLGMSPKDSFLGRFGLWHFSILSQLCYLLVGYLAYLAIKIDRQKFLRYFSLSLTACLICLCLFALLAEKETIFQLNRAVGTSANPNSFAFYLSTSFVFLLTLFLVEKKMINRFLLAGTIFLLLVTIIATFSRASWLSLFLVIPLFVFLLKKIVWHQKVIILAIVLLALIPFSSLIFRRAQGTFVPSSRDSVHIRLQEWDNGLRIWKQFPVFGVGPENIDLYYPQVRRQEQNLIPEEWQWRTVAIRNWYIELLAASGLIGLGAVAIFWGRIILLAKKQNNFLSLMPLACFLINAFFLFPRQVDFIFVSVLVALILAQTKTKTIFIKPRYFIFLGVIGIVLLALVLRVFAAEQAAYRSILLLETDPLLAREQILKAYRFNPIFDKNLRQLIFVQGELIRDNKLVDRQTAINDYLSYLEKLEACQQRDVENIKTLTAGFMRYAGFTQTSHERALTYGRKLIKLDPTSPGSWDTYGLVFLDSQNYSEAENIFTYIVSELKPDYPYAYFHLGETYKQKGDKEKARQAYNQAVNLGYPKAKEEIDKMSEE